MHPAAYTAFSKISFSTQDIGQMAALVGIDKLSHEDAAKNWLAGWLAGWLATKTYRSLSLK
jgi:glycine betaine/proline transport system substrate-binding protein